MISIEEYKQNPCEAVHDRGARAGLGRERVRIGGHRLCIFSMVKQEAGQECGAARKG